MVKMIPHHVVSITPATKPIFDLLGNDFPLDDPENVIEIACEGVAVIARSTATLPAMSFLVANKLFDYEDDANILYLPINKREAAVLGRSPFGDPPIESYVTGMVQFIESITPTETFAAAKEGNAEAAAKILDSIRGLQTHLRNGLDAGKVFVAFPYNAEDQARDEAERAGRKLQ